MTFLSSQHHSFDIFLAKQYGVECTILIHHFQHWIRINRFNKRNIIEGRCWSYQSRKKIQEHFPYWSVDEVRRLCEKLVKMGVLISSNFNKSPIDKTCWYAFADEKAFGVDEEFSKMFYERQNCHTSGKIATPIPDTKTTYISKENIQKKKTTPSPAPSKSAPSANASALCVLFSKLNKMKEAPKSWIKDCEKLLKVCDMDMLKKMIEWIQSNDFWSTRIFNPNSLRRNLAQIQSQMARPATKKDEEKKKREEEDKKEQVLRKNRGENLPKLLKILKVMLEDKEIDMYHESINYLSISKNGLECRFQYSKEEFMKEIIKTLIEWGVPIAEYGLNERKRSYIQRYIIE